MLFLVACYLCLQFMLVCIGADAVDLAAGKSEIGFAFLGNVALRKRGL